jgi:stress-induced morphogen
MMVRTRIMRITRSYRYSQHAHVSCALGSASARMPVCAGAADALMRVGVARWIATNAYNAYIVDNDYSELTQLMRTRLAYALVHDATCTMQHALCVLHHASCVMQNASRSETRDARARTAWAALSTS